MSMFLRLVRSEGIKKGLALFSSKDARICNITRRCVSSTPEKNASEEDEPYVVKKSWVSYGFSYDSERSDRHLMHQTFFVTISICFVLGALIIGYMPDPLLKDWAQREAYLQLRHREENGLPLIDPNLIDPSKFTLPNDDELINVEIII